MSKKRSGQIWFSADQHFGHENIIRYNKRPFASLGEMTHALMAAHLQSVHAFDSVYWLGDLLFMGTEIPHFSKTSTHTVLIRGNHDKAPLEEYLRAGISEVHTSLQIDFAGEPILLTHDPYPVLEQAAQRQGISLKGLMWDNPIVQTVAESLPTKVFCGHMHTLFKRYGQLLNVGVDVWDYRPITLQQALEAYKEPSVISGALHRRSL